MAVTDGATFVGSAAGSPAGRIGCDGCQLAAVRPRAAAALAAASQRKPAAGSGGVGTTAGNALTGVASTAWFGA
jgi:hypothetical protein